MAISKYFVVIYSFIAKDILFLLPISLINLSVDLLHLVELRSLLLYSTYLRYMERSVAPLTLSNKGRQTTLQLLSDKP